MPEPTKEQKDVLEMVNREGVEKLNKGLSITVKIICIPLILGALAVAVLCFTSIFEYFDSILQTFDVNIERQLKETYHQNFIVLSQNTNENGNGTYTMAPKKQKDLIFTVYKKGGTMVQDYEANAVKYYISKYQNKELLSLFEEKESKILNKEAPGVKFLSYHLTIQLKRYDEIPEASKKAYRLMQYILEKDDTLSAFISFSIGEYESPLEYQTNISCEAFENIQKYEYIDYIKKNGVEISIPQQEIVEHWQTRTRIMSINDSIMKDTNPFGRPNNVVTFNPAVGEYEVWLPDLIKGIPEMQRVENEDKLLFRNTRYKITLKDEGIKNNTIPYHCRMSYLQQLFGVSITYGKETVIESMSGVEKIVDTIGIKFP